MYRMYGMYLVLLSARMGPEVAARQDAGAGASVFAIVRKRPPDARRGYPWRQLGAGPHPPAPPTALLALRAGPPPGWPWEESFAMALPPWTSRLRWLSGQGQVTYVELALDFEAHAEQALPAPSDHRLRGVTLPLRTRGQVLKMALDALQPHLQARDLLQGKEVWMAKSLLPLGGFRCVERAVRPLFARPDAMLFQMRHLEAHCRALWTRRLAWLGAGRQDVFLLDYLPPAGPWLQPLRPFQCLPRRRVLARPARGRRRGRGPRGTAAAGGPVCQTPGPALCRLRAAGHRALLPAGSRRAPHGCGASAADVAAASAAGRGRLRGVVRGCARLAKRAQTPRS